MNPTAPAKCQKCQDERSVATSDDEEPWSVWENLPPGADLSVRLGLIRPKPCPECCP